MEYHAYHTYIHANGERFFTAVLLPAAQGRFPCVVCRSPYVGHMADMAEEDIVREYLRGAQSWLSRGYAVLHQHCKGQGKSSGAFVPYIHEREDGLAFRAWIREQPFYNGELFLLGGSYTASLHYATAPFEQDIRGAVFEVQDSERYRLWYRNGQMRKGHANWHFSLYKDKCGLDKRFDMSSFSRLPLTGLSESVLGERAEDFEQMLEADSPAHPFWDTRPGGADARDAVTHADIPVLLTTGYNDFYIGGVFRMWEQMDEATRQKSALLVSPYDHGDSYHGTLGRAFPCGGRGEAFGADYAIDWFDNIRTAAPLPFEKGVITYYRTFEAGWQSDFYKTPTALLALPMGEGMRRFTYDPLDPPAFRGEGLSAESFDGRTDVVTVYTSAFERDTFVKGRMQAVLSVTADCPDTTVYVRISLQKADGAYVLRHDITALSRQTEAYQAGERVALSFCFDEYAFLIKAGECLRLDIAATDDNAYVCHTNRRGPYAQQTGADKATVTVYTDDSRLLLPTELAAENEA